MIDSLLHRWLRVPYTLNVRLARRPKKAKATVLFIHGIGNNGEAWEDVIKQLPKDIYVVTIDLLGFGESPRPKWAVYSAKTQVRSVLATYLKLRITSPVIVVGHSLGALVAIEMAKRYPLLVKSLILCSPPLYDTNDAKKFGLKSDSILRKMYQSAIGRPEDFVKAAAIAMKYKLINKSFNVTTDNVTSYMASLEAMIINQTSLSDAERLKVPTTIIRGTLDPLVVAQNLRRVAKSNASVRLKTVLAGHEVKGLFVSSVVKAIGSELQSSPKTGIIKLKK